MALTKSEKRMMLNNFDTLLLSLASLLALFYSVVQTNLGGAKFFYIYPLLIVGLGMPLFGYALRTFRFEKFSVRDSIIGNFLGWTYLAYGVVMYIVSFMIPEYPNNNLTFSTILVSLVSWPSILIFPSLITILLIFPRLRKIFLRMFGEEDKRASTGDVLMAILPIISYVSAFFTSLVLYMAYAFYLLDIYIVAILLTFGGFALFIANFCSWPQIYRPKYSIGLLTIGIIILILSFVYLKFL